MLGERGLALGAIVGRAAAAGLAVLAFAAFLSATRIDAARAAGPNILVIVTDDQRAQTLGVMPRTTRIFYENGRSFPNAFVTTPLCCPSRASIFTGLFAHNHGIHGNGNANLPQSRTVQRYLHDAGYRTAIMGKYLNSWKLANDPPYFDRWAIIHPASYWDAEFNVDGNVGTVPGYSTNVMAAKAVRWLDQFEGNDDQPWFLYIAPVAPHVPSTPAPEYETAPVPTWQPVPSVFEADRSDKPPWVQAKSVSLTFVRHRREKMQRTLMSVDALTGRVFHELDALGERDNTLAIYLSDNGYAWGEHGLIGKDRPYTEAIHVPLAMRWPGHFARGSIETGITTNVDLAPTMLAAANVTPLQPMDGVSVLGAWRRSRLFTEYWGHLPMHGWAQVRTRRYAYIEYYDEARSNTIFREYYRMTRDPYQLRNLLHDGDPSNDPGISELRALIREFSTCVGRSCPGTELSSSSTRTR
jgi:arylsulfatase A-like enzyme